MKKKKILLVNEDSRISTGYAVHGYELLKRWHAAGYDVAELAVYPPGPPIYPWKWYNNSPQNEQEQKFYQQHGSLGEFGYWKFEEVCLDHQPDVCVNIRDFWMAAEHDSPYAGIFYFISQYCNDSAPMNPDWVGQLEKSNKIFTFSKFAEDLVKQQLKIRADQLGPIAPICADENVFKPLNKQQIRQEFGIPQDAIVIGTVMRNQKRKLYPDLIEAFWKLVKYCRDQGRNDIADRLFLHIHAYWPDLGWDFPRKLCEFGGNKILFTYSDKNCGRISVKQFSGEADWCETPNCSHHARLPGVQSGVSREELAKIYNTFDLYVQYANAEATGVPILEAAACGIRVMATNYSAMKSFIENTDSIPIDVLAYLPEAESGVYRALPSQEDFIKKAYDFLSLPATTRIHHGMRSREKYLQYYNWDKTAQMWMDAFDEAPEADWKQPPRFLQRITELPPNLHINGNLDMLMFADYITRFYPYSEYDRLCLIKNLTQGFVHQGYGYQVCEDSLIMSRAHREAYGAETAINQINNRIDRWNHWEQRRKEKFGL